ncbi:hypothetical protein ROZALSC1DRAFT_31234, partial [Rozella allomycis CSF55]
SSVAYSFAKTRLYEENVVDSILKLPTVSNITQISVNRSVCYVTFNSLEDAIKASEQNLVVNNNCITPSLCLQKKFKFVSLYLKNVPLVNDMTALNQQIMQAFSNFNVDDVYLYVYSNAINVRSDIVKIIIRTDQPKIFVPGSIDINGHKIDVLDSKGVNLNKINCQYCHEKNHRIYECPKLEICSDCKKLYPINKHKNYKKNQKNQKTILKRPESETKEMEKNTSEVMIFKGQNSFVSNLKRKVNRKSNLIKDSINFSDNNMFSILDDQDVDIVKDITTVSRRNQSIAQTKRTKNISLTKVIKASPKQSNIIDISMSTKRNISFKRVENNLHSDDNTLGTRRIKKLRLVFNELLDIPFNMNVNKNICENDIIKENSSDSMEGVINNMCSDPCSTKTFLKNSNLQFLTDDSSVAKKIDILTIQDHHFVNDFPHHVYQNSIWTPAQSVHHGGVAIISFDPKIKMDVIKSENNFLLVKVIKSDMQIKEFYLLTLYGPPQRKLIKQFVKSLPNINEYENIIVTGDFNCTSSSQDRTSDNNQDFYYWKCYENYLTKLNDVFQYNNDKTKRFTYNNASVINSKSRIDKIFVSDSFTEYLQQDLQLHYYPRSDHLLLNLKIGHIENEKQFGPGYWKLNNTILKDPMFRLDLHNLIFHFKCKYSDNVIFYWDLFKDAAKKLCIKYSKKLKKERVNKLENIWQQISIEKSQSRI